MIAQRGQVVNQIPLTCTPMPIKEPPRLTPGRADLNASKGAHCTSDTKGRFPAAELPGIGLAG